MPIPDTNRKKEIDKFFNIAAAYQDGMSEADYNLRLEHDAETRALLAKLMDDNQVDAIAYP